MGIFRSDPIARIIAAALRRDGEAEARDRRAEARDVRATARAAESADAADSHAAAESDAREAAVDRVIAGEDRDAAAADRHDLVVAAEAEGQGPPDAGAAVPHSRAADSRRLVDSRHDLLRRGRDLVRRSDDRRTQGAHEDS